MALANDPSTAPQTGPKMRDRFEEIYATGEWGIGSGDGSDASENSGYVQFLQRFLKERNIKSVVDLGCGDWQTSRFVDWSGIHYQGFDLVRPVIEQNIANFSRPGVEFAVFSGNFSDLPQADLLIVKDVLQHWSNDAVRNFLPTLKRYPYSLVTNCIFSHGVTANNDIPDGGFRRLDLRLPPFSLQAEEMYDYSSRRPLWRRLIGRPLWRKVVLLVRGSTSGTST
jgi:SAM-dependent methyltransferase